MDCGIHVCLMYEKIMAAPLLFEMDAARNSLSTWFDPKVAKEGRDFLRKSTEDMATNQRAPNGELCGDIHGKAVDLSGGPKAARKKVKLLFYYGKTEDIHFRLKCFWRRGVPQHRYL